MFAPLFQLKAHHSGISGVFNDNVLIVNYYDIFLISEICGFTQTHSITARSVCADFFGRMELFKQRAREDS